MQKHTKKSTPVKAQSPLLTVGLDLGDRYSHVCVLDGDGEIRSEGRVRMNQQVLAQYFGSLGQVRVAMEASTHSGWVSRLLSELGHQVIVAHAREVRKIHQSDRKNDRNDARALARLARLDPALLHPTGMRSAEMQIDLSLLRARDSLVRARGQLINTVRSLVKGTGARLPMCSGRSFSDKVVEHVPAALTSTIGPMLASIAALTAQLRVVDAAVAELATVKYPQSQLLQQISGVGPITALAFVLTLFDQNRFAHSRDVAAYLGLVPRQASSGERNPQLGITKSGNSYLRRLLVNCAHYILGPFGPDSDLRSFGDRIAQRGGKNAKKRAVVAVARKLAVLLHRLWVTGQRYEPQRVATAA